MSEGFQGCIQYFRINNRVFNISLPSNDIKNGLGIDQCSDESCLSKPCVNGGRCRMAHDEKMGVRAECVCQKDTIGKHCETRIEPCRNGSSPCGVSNQCVPTSDGKFQCVCGGNFDGKLCKNRVVLKKPFTAGFTGKSFIERANLSLSIDSIDVVFYSQKPEAVLIYYGDCSNRSYFVGIKIQKFYLSLVVSVRGVFEEIKLIFNSFYKLNSFIIPLCYKK
jgi:hypothetical protein